MDIQKIKPEMDALFDEMLSNMEGHHSCVASCKDYYAICLMKCDERVHDPYCTSNCRSELESCINGCPNDLTEGDRKIFNEYMDKIDLLIQSS
jgi:hypothetical protein